MTRDELIEAGARALPRYGAWTEMAASDVTAVILDAVGPLIFKSAEEHVTFLWGGRGWVEHRDCDVRIANLRARVEALPIHYTGKWAIGYVALSDVLALFEGASNG